MFGYRDFRRSLERFGFWSAECWVCQGPHPVSAPRPHLRVSIFIPVQVCGCPCLSFQVCVSFACFWPPWCLLPVPRFPTGSDQAKGETENNGDRSL